MPMFCTNTDCVFVCQSAIEKYGKTAQLNMLIEEMSELTQAICKHLRGFDNHENIAEEIVDVEIMLNQARMIFDNYDLCEEYEGKKIQRLRQRLKISKQ